MSTETPPAQTDKSGWSKAISIGLLAGVPTAAFLQISFIQTMRQRGAAIRPSRFGGGLLGSMLPAGIGLAAFRDVIYWGATQKQVQNVEPSFGEDLFLNAVIVVGPLFFDTLSVKIVDPAFKMPKSPLTLMKVACPPEAFLGRMLWIPAYNYAYVSAQQRFGEETPLHATAGLAIGSLAASVMAYPLFMYKTNMLLHKSEPHASGSGLSGIASQYSRLVTGSLAQTCGAETLGGLGKVGPVGVGKAVFSGVTPHTLGNIGPDVLCMGFARVAFAGLCTMGLFAQSASDD